jgi:excinuclease ABC subunit A
MKNDVIKIVGAREHNLKNLNVEIPRNKFVVITGLSGSGKSSLAFDTIYAEGQRRYVESLSSYARQFLGMIEKPDVDYIEGLSPAISIDQKANSKNPRSTVGTITEIYDYLRLLFSRIGKPHCVTCGQLLTSQTPTQIVDEIKKLKTGKFAILAPIISGQKGAHKDIYNEIKKIGFIKVRVNNEIYDLTKAPKLSENKKNYIDIVVDIIDLKDLDKPRLSSAIETALDLGKGIISIYNMSTKKDTIFSKNYSCTKCGFSLPEIQPRIFSFNSPHGACQNCQGLGTKMEIDENLVIPNKNLTLAEGAIRPWIRISAHSNWLNKVLEAVSKKHKFSVNKPVSALKPADLKIVFYGTGDEIYKISNEGMGKVKESLTTFEGVIPNLERRYNETGSDFIIAEIKKYMVERICPVCHGERLRPETLGITVGDYNIVQISTISIEKLNEVFEKINKNLTVREKKIADQILKEIMMRLSFLKNVGLSYLTLDRTAMSLAGGESQRIRLATQISSGLVGVVYILDEPTIGLHNRDTDQLLKTLQNLRDLGNSVIVVEHDKSTIMAADYIYDIGPGAGDNGGKIVAEGTIDQILKNKNSLTGKYLTGEKEIQSPKKRRKPSDRFLEIIGATEFNLKNIDAKIPLGLFVCVTGVSGSGKSTLISEILSKALAKKFHRSKHEPGKHEKIIGLENLDKVISIDQSPIGRTPRSNPATFTGVFTQIRDLFAESPDAKMKNFKSGRFSFNVKGGRCETCKGEGQIKIEMHFLPDVWITCDECKGKRYTKEALEIHYNGKTIADVLDMTVVDALEFFKDHPQIKSKLKILDDVGLGYVHLGQSAVTLSGGEAQRVKLATELSRKATGKTLYILDEPTTGLHFEDINKLLKVLNRLVDKGNTVLMIEHNMDVIKSADWLIDLGPDGGDKGGEIVAFGTPEKVAQSKKSFTGQYLKKVL